MVIAFVCPGGRWLFACPNHRCSSLRQHIPEKSMSSAMATGTSKPSRVPIHIRQFHHSPTACLQTQAPYSYTIRCATNPREDCTCSVELCPSHWRLASNKSLRSKVKDLLGKGRTDSTARATTHQRQKHRPLIMRMKDSDDYITARAANPRTGLISPSIGSPSPRPCTPNTPGEALQLHFDELPSSTPEARAQPALRRANEGRKVSAGSANRWQWGEKGWFSDALLAAASPRQTNAIAGAEVARPGLRDDQFILHMPSAREPQPYTYPGRTPEQIAAFEHQLSTARRISDDRCGRRLVHGGRKISGQALSSRGKRQTSGTHAHVRALHVEQTGEDTDVARRRCCTASEPRQAYYADGPETKNFAPYHSPRTPAAASTHAEMQTLLTTLPENVQYATLEGSPMHRKPVYTSSRREDVALTADEAQSQSIGDFATVGCAKHFTNLSKLPRVRLVHPELASLPQATVARSDRPEPRKCSLGCQRDTNGGECRDRSSVPTDGAPQYHRPQFDFQATDRATHNLYFKSALLTILRAIFMDVVASVKRVHLPKVGLEPLITAGATRQQKLAAMKMMVMMSGQAFVVLMMVAIVWRLGAAVVYALEMIVWPLVVPFKILRWLAGGS